MYENIGGVLRRKPIIKPTVYCVIAVVFVDGNFVSNAISTNQTDVYSVVSESMYVYKYDVMCR